MSPYVLPINWLFSLQFVWELATEAANLTIHSTYGTTFWAIVRDFAVAAYIAARIWRSRGRKAVREHLGEAKDAAIAVTVAFLFTFFFHLFVTVPNRIDTEARGQTPPAIIERHLAPPESAFAAPTPSPLRERAHVRIEEPRLRVPEIRVGAIVEVGTYCRNITSTSIPARDMFCPSKSAVVLTDSNHNVSVEDEKEGYRKFEHDLPALKHPRGEGPTIFPPEAQYGITQLELNEKAVDWLNSGRGTIIVFGLVLFNDDFGPHRTESCFCLHSLISELPRVWAVCRIHTGIKY